MNSEQYQNDLKAQCVNGILCVTAAIMVRDDRVLIAQRKDNDKLAGKWEFPGGKIEENETPERLFVF
jgi:8-oxo-dGTP pyrophosphatase MutT (NUDIX family)